MGQLHEAWRSLAGPVGRAGALELLVGSDEYGRTMREVAPLWGIAVLAGSLIGVLLGTSAAPMFHRAAAAIVIGGLLGGFVLPLFVWLRVFKPTSGWWIPLAAFLGAGLGVVVVALLGPLHQESAVFEPAFAAGFFVFAPRRVAVPAISLGLAGYIVLVLASTGYGDSVTRIGIVASFTVATGALMDWVVRRLGLLSAQERSAAARVAELADELGELNQILEDRVSSQVTEIETLGRLRRFLSPQVADVVLNSGDEELLKPHRRKVAVLFCDLRGFTAFANTAEPEEIVDALDGYFRIVGCILEQHEAIVGSFAGDGIMAYLNDPVPCDDPAGTAVAMSIELRDKLSEFSTTWSGRGHDLGYGVGIAYGYATMAIIGFEARSDYTPLGSVVNLASRLCSEASSGEVLIDARANDAIDARYETQVRPVSLKGLPGTANAYQVIGASTPIH